MYRICHPCDYRTCRFQYVIELKAAMIDFNELNQSSLLIFVSKFKNKHKKTTAKLPSYQGL